MSVRVAALVLAAVTAQTAITEKPPVDDIGSIMVAFGAHLDNHPMARAEDLYKFLHQAVYGPGHAIPNREAAAKWLELEIEGVGPPEGDEAVCEALGGEPPLVRINLRPFVAHDGDPDQLLDAFVAAAGRVHGTAQQMEVVLALAASYVQCAGRAEVAPALQALSAEMAVAGYPAIHHSKTYIDAYQPAYRVVEEAVARGRGWCGDPPEP